MRFSVFTNIDHPSDQLDQHNFSMFPLADAFASPVALPLSAKMELAISCALSIRFPCTSRHAHVPVSCFSAVSSTRCFRPRSAVSRGGFSTWGKLGSCTTAGCLRLNAWEGKEGSSLAEENSSQEVPSLLEQIEGYELKEEMEYGTIVVKPLSKEWIPETSKLLADSFGETLGYRGFSAQIFQRQLVDYLKSSLEMGIAGVILISILQPNENFEAPDEPTSNSGPKFQGFSFVPPPGTSIPSATAEKNAGGLMGMLSVLGGAAEGAGDGRKKTASFRDFRDDLDDMSDAAIEQRWTPSEKKSQSQQGKAESSTSKDSSDPAPNSPLNLIAMSDSASDTKQALVADDPGLVSTDPGKQIVGVSKENVALKEEEEEEEQKGKEYLVGSVELSLDVSTRSLFGGLVTPVKEGAYMCNMAVLPHFQRQGHATRMLKACEELSRVSELEKLSLHVQVTDEGAQALYRRYGFKDIKQDSGLLAMVGLIPKIFMQLQLS